MFEVGVETQFEAAHALRGDFGPAVRRHGHTYRVELAVRGAALAGDGTLCDIGLLQQALARAVGPLNYQDLDEIPAFAGRNTTAEVVAEHLFEAVAGQLAGHASRVAMAIVRVWESPRAYASYEGPLVKNSVES